MKKGPLYFLFALVLSSCNTDTPLPNYSNITGQCKLSQKLEYQGEILQKTTINEYDNFLNIIKSIVIVGNDSLVTAYKNSYAGNSIIESRGISNGRSYSSMLFDYYDSGELKFTEYRLDDEPYFIETYEYFRDGKTKNYFKRYSEKETVEISYNYEDEKLIEFHSKLNGETAEHSIYTYRPDGQILYQYILGNNSSDTIRYSYDTQNRLVKTIRSSSTEVFEFDEKGLLKSKSVFYSNGNLWKEFFYEYDERDVLIRELERLNKEHPFLVFKEYKYFTNGELMEEKQYDTWSYGNNHLVFQTTFDAMGNILKFVNYDDSGNGQIKYLFESKYSCN